VNEGPVRVLVLVLVHERQNEDEPITQSLNHSTTRMLLELRISNFAVIESLAIHCEAGLNALTGETGAGKSIIVGALGLLLGERASSESIRTGASKATVEGVFDVARNNNVLGMLAEQGIEADDGLLILRREVSLEGRSRAWVNGAASTATFVGQLGRTLVDLHGQHEGQTLMRGDEQRAILDEYAGATELATQVANAFHKVRDLQNDLEELERRRRDAEQRADYLRFQVNEINTAKLRSGEDVELTSESVRLEHSEELAQLATTLSEALYASDDSIATRLGEVRRVLDHLIRIDRTQDDARELLDTAYYAIEELGRRFGDYGESIEYDPARLQEVRTRLDLLYRLKAKYGPEIEDVVATAEKANEELSLVDDGGLRRKEVEAALASAQSDLARVANDLSKQRRKAAARLQKEVTALLPDLGMASGKFDVALSAHDTTSAHGNESVEFLIALNAGFEPRSLSRVASGGELSRVMLALKTILARIDRVPTLIFDEVDAGIGGRVATQVADKLRDVAQHHQVFVITHLPQLASRAAHHLLVEKVEREGTTLTRVSELKGEERVRELARMLGGDPESTVSLEHAREMLR
jgi:DNA repair protein RecN (Recombination protein N)